MRSFRIALAQINPAVGDLAGNAEKIRKAIEGARNVGADLVALPELALTGYPPEDLLLRPSFIEDNIRIMKQLVEECRGITAIIGFVDREDDIYNAAAVVHDGALACCYHKINLPNYGVFDEYRYFQRGGDIPVVQRDDLKIGLNICEDLWMPEGPLGVQALAGAELLVNINASPYHMGKVAAREKMISVRAADHGIFIAYLNMVGGQDELVFDGGSRVISPWGETIAEAPLFEESTLVVDIDPEWVMRSRLRDSRHRRKARALDASAWTRVVLPPLRNDDVGVKAPLPVIRPVPCSQVEKVYRALALGTRDYIKKNGFPGVLVAMSGGVDSSLVTAIAVDALGKEHVRGIFLPTSFTSSESREDAEGLARTLGIRLDTLEITGVFADYLELLAPLFGDAEPDVTEENLQARIRGDIVMALSNKWGLIVLTTGNKSEMSVGYATLYGDMAGGFAVIKDVPKTLVYDLCRWRNSQKGGSIIPERVLIKPPSAELRPGQLDTDSLPPYESLDPVIQGYVEDDLCADEIQEVSGCDAGCVRRVIGLIDRSEYKRRQAPPGIKITPRAFGRDRRMPITNAYRGRP